MLSEQFGIPVTANNADAASFADVLFIAVPPPAVPAVLAELKPTLRPGSIVISLAAAVPISLMRNSLGDKAALIRVIPNTPSQVGFGMNPYCFEPGTSEAQRLTAKEILAIFGQALEIPENLMNTATALTAVGPTYLFPLLTALKREAVERGLSDTDAHFAVAHLVAGTAQLMLATGKEPNVLKLMIGTRTISEDAADSVVAEAYRLALDKVEALQAKMVAANVVGRIGLRLQGHRSDPDANTGASEKSCDS